jgi:hypothetical protein
LSFKTPPDRQKPNKTEEKISTQTRLAMPARQSTVPKQIVEKMITSDKVQMSSNSEEAVEKLKEIINGKSYENLVKKKNLKRILRNTELDLKEKRMRLRILKRKHKESSTEKQSVVQTEHTTSQENKACFHSASVDSNVIPLPPRPTSLRLQKPVFTNIEVELPNIISRLLQSKSELKQPSFKFEVSDEAATSNMTTLRDNAFNLDLLLNKHPSITSYGSEFKPIAELEELLGHHPRWPEMQKRLKCGAHFPVEAIDKETRQRDLHAMQSRGNHKSALLHEEHLSAAFVKEVEKGWILLLPDKEVNNIPDLELAPMGVADQLGVSASGEFVSKLRITHDLSFPQEFSGESINSRVNQDELEPCMFGHTFLRVIHHIVYLRQKYPNKIIWLRKEDFKSAYRRLHLNAKTALKSAVRVKLKEKFYILVSLRLPFGGSPCPSDFCLVSDIITDTINDLLASKNWDPKLIRSDYTKKIPAAIPSDPSIPFAKARSLSVPIVNEPDSKADVFVDDIISITVDSQDNLARLMAAPCTVIHAVAHSATDTHLKRQNLISDEKNEAEGAPEEIKICLGWQINTRALLVSLPSHKYLAWNSQIEDVIQAKTVKYKTLESILGRLENVAIILKMLGHFLNNIRSIQIKASKSKHNQKLTKNAIEELKLSQSFLKRAHEGINMNLLTFREPTRIYIGDASEHGLGGMSLKSGKAWRYLISMKLRGRAHINLLEFLVQVISIWVDIESNSIEPQDCLLAMGDNTTAAGWCRRTNFRESSESNTDWIAKQQVARKLATLILDSETVLYTQWFKGSWNIVTDSLSRDIHLFSDQSHTQFLKSTVACQIPPNFQIQKLPEKISFFISSVLLQLPVKELRSKPQKASELAHLKLGKNFSKELDSQDPCIWMDLAHSRKISSCLPLLRQLDQVPSLQDITESWWKEQSSPPSHMYLRPSGQTIGRTRDWTQTARSVSY